jgi:hypothetical protein
MQCSIRDLMWLTAVVALAVVWQRDRAAWSLQQRAWDAERQSLVELRTMRGIKLLSPPRLQAAELSPPSPRR